MQAGIMLACIKCKARGVADEGARVVVVEEG